MTRIAAIDAWAVNVPLEAPYLMAPGTYPGMSRTVVRVVTEDGLEGLGEGGSPGDAAVIAGPVGRRLLGEEADVARSRLAAGVPAIAARTDGRVVPGNPLAAVEMALCDLAARAAGLPLSAWLGGAVRDAVAVSEYFAYRPGREETPDEVAAYCARMAAEHGATVFEGKVGVRPLERDLELVAAVRAAIGSATLRLDANMAWSERTAREAVRELAPFGVANLEEPVAGLDAMARLRGHTAIPFSAHAVDLAGARERGVPDAVVASAQACGGIAGTVATVDACAAAGIGFWFYSGDLGIATAAHLHLAAALEPITAASQSLLRWTADDVIADGPLVARGGTLRVPDGPGLGVALDPDGLARGVERFRRDGPYDYYTGPSLPRY